MNYDEFLEKMEEALPNALLPHVGAVEISKSNVMKLGRDSYKGLLIKKSNESIGVSMDFMPFFEQFEKGRSFQSILRSAVKEVNEHFQSVPDIDAGLFQDYDRIKEGLVMQVVGAEGNSDKLSNVPHRFMEDMAIVYRYETMVPNQGTLSVLITNPMLETYGIDAAKLHEDAMKSAPQIHPVSLRPMFEVLTAMGPADLEIPSMGPSLYVATTEVGENGAAVIAYPGFFDEAAKIAGPGFFVIPSSRHEVLLLSDNGTFSAGELKDMVAIINATEVRPEDVLTNNVYHYDALERVFETGECWEERSKGLDALGKPSVIQNLKDNRTDLAGKNLPEGRPARHDPVL